MFGNLDRAQAKFGSTMVTSYPGRSGTPWPGGLVIGSTITCRGEGESISLFESVVGGWAYVKELVMTNIKERGE